MQNNTDAYPEGNSHHDRNCYLTQGLPQELAGRRCPARPGCKLHTPAAPGHPLPPTPACRQIAFSVFWLPSGPCLLPLIAHTTYNCMTSSTAAVWWLIPVTCLQSVGWLIQLPVCSLLGIEADETACTVCLLVLLKPFCKTWYVETVNAAVCMCLNNATA